MLLEYGIFSWFSRVVTFKTWLSHKSLKKSINEQTRYLRKQEAELSQGWADRTAFIWKPASDFQSRKDAISQWLQSHSCHDGAAISNATINARTRYGNTVNWRTWVMTAGTNCAFKIASKPLQIETWFLLTAYKNSSSPYPTVPSLVNLLRRIV